EVWERLPLPRPGVGSQALGEAGDDAPEVPAHEWPGACDLRLEAPRPPDVGPAVDECELDVGPIGAHRLTGQDRVRVALGRLVLDRLLAAVGGLGAEAFDGAHPARRGRALPLPERLPDERPSPVL